SKTKRLLDINGVSYGVDFCLAPLALFKDTDNQTYSYYSCRNAIKTLSEMLDIYRSKVLLIVDGPPGSTNKHARYPALPVVLEYLHGADIDIVMDDYTRLDEKEIAQRWKELLTANQYHFSAAEAKLQKG